MKILLVDDEWETYAEFDRELRRRYPDVVIRYAASAVEGFDYFEAEEHDLIVLDYQMGGGANDGTEFLRRLGQRLPDRRRPEIIFVTQYDQKIPASTILDLEVRITLFLDKGDKGTSFTDMLLIAVQMVMRQLDGYIRYNPDDLYGRKFIDLILREAMLLTRSERPGYWSIDQQRQISTVVNSYMYTLLTSKQWDAEDVLQSSIFFAEALCKVFDIPDQLVEVLRRFLNMEEILYTIPHYRDHFFHQMKVFLLGFCIINALNRDICLRGTLLAEKEGMKTWFIASAFHDIGYPFEKMSAWLNKFVEGVLRSPIDDDSKPIIPMTFQWGALFGRRYHAYHLHRVVEQVTNLYGRRDPKYLSEILTGVSSRAIDGADHGLFSSLVIQNLLGGRVQDTELIPAALAIALHNEDVARVVQQWIGRQTFEKDPLSFLLAYCDLAQDWGRTRPLGMSRNGYQEFGYPVFDSDEVYNSTTMTVRVYLRYGTAMPVQEQQKWRRDIYAKYIETARSCWGVGVGGTALPAFSIVYRDGADAPLEELVF